MADDASAAGTLTSGATRQSGEVLRTLFKQGSGVGLVPLGVAALIYCSVFFRERMLPRWLAVGTARDRADARDRGVRVRHPIERQ